MMAESLNLTAALPEIFISVMACIILIYSLYDKSCRAQLVPFVLSVGTLLLAGLLAVGQFGQFETAFGDAYVLDKVSSSAKAFVAFIGAAVFAYSARYNEAHGYFKVEFYILGLFAIVGMMLMASSAHFLTLYVGLELLSLSLYAMVAFFRDEQGATEAAMKYFVLGALASAILLYAVSLFYGLTGSLVFADVARTLAEMPHDNLGLQLAIVLIIVGLAFKLGLVPFHMWVPDVYQGSPTSTTAFLAAAPKIAAFVMVYRVIGETVQAQWINWQLVLLILAVLSISVGNVIAIAQTNLKRMLAYSTVSHMGFFLLGVASNSGAGFAASYFYMMIYAVMSLAAFGFILLFADKDKPFDQLDDIKGIAQTQPWVGLLLLVLMFSMAGVPPFAGFFAKFSVLQTLVAAGFQWVAVIAVLFAVVGAYYYLRVIKLAYFDAPEGDHEIRSAKPVRVLFAVNVLALLLVLPWIGEVISLTKSMF